MTMEAIEDREMLHLILGTLESKDLSRAARVRRAWRLAAEGLWQDICLAEFPTTRAIHALPGYRKSWLQLYGEMTRTRRPLAGPKWEDFKWAVSVSVGTPHNQRLLHTGVYDGWKIEKEYDLGYEKITLAEPVEFTKDTTFRIDVVVLRATDSKVCVAFDGLGDESNEEFLNYRNGDACFSSQAEAAATPATVLLGYGHGYGSAERLQLATWIWTHKDPDTNLGEWVTKYERGETLSTSELTLDVKFYPDCYGCDDWEEGTMCMDAILPLLLR